MASDLASLTAPDWVEPRDYQQDAVNSWLEQNGRGILNMATGTGKTVTSLLACTEVVKRTDRPFVLIVSAPYQHLVDQWAEDVRDFGADPVLAYRSRAQWQPEFERQALEVATGSRDRLAVITTHDTFASEAFQKGLSRVQTAATMLIGDEVHHLGAPHRREQLPGTIQLRMGLSATPDRWYDDEGTEALHAYFGDVVFEYGLKEAIANGALCEYYYIPHVIELTDEETEQYIAISRSIGKLINGAEGESLEDADLQDNPTLERLLFKRARLVGTAANKQQLLYDLITEQDDIDHTLVYCGDGSVDDEITGETDRHVDATVTLLRDECGIDARRFTARESQSDRETLLEAFEAGDCEALVAIRCLDEGVDVPATRTAYMLASSSNPRQFVQRRGRILRTHKDKEYAVIHDCITMPKTRSHPQLQEDSLFNIERNLLRKELERVETFAEAARNHPSAAVPGHPAQRGSLDQLKDQYNLTTY